MSIALLKMISIVCYCIAFLCFVIAVVLFFVFDIVKLYNELSGRSAKKAIEEIRRRNEASGDKRYQVSAYNQARGMITDRISESGSVVKKDASRIPIITEKIQTTNQNLDCEETQVLELQSNVTTRLATQQQETSLLTQEDEGHTQLLPVVESAVLEEQDDTQIHVDVEFSYMASDEIIQ